MSRRKRNLSPEERAMWDSIARQVEPLKGAGPLARTPAKPSAAAAKPAPEPPPPAPVPDFRVGEKADTRRGHDVLPGLAQQLARAPMQMDAKSFGRMKRGKLKPEGRIDLHGMTVDEAHPALIGFILRSHGEGKRLVLVITGKGRLSDDAPPLPVRRGVLRHQVPQWMRLPPLAGLILQVTPAHVRHGGEGAYYVYLRRGR